MLVCYVTDGALLCDLRDWFYACRVDIHKVATMFAPTGLLGPTTPISPPKVVEDNQKLSFAPTGLLGQSREETQNHALAETTDTLAESRRIDPSAHPVEEISKASFLPTGLLCQSREPLKDFEISTCIPFLV